MSDNARNYLEQRNVGRQPLRPEDAEAILDMPSDAYYIDGELGLTDLIVQRVYASRSTVQNSTLHDLTDNKYQYTLGLQSRSRNFLWSFAVNENAANGRTSPDLGVQVGIAYMPRAQ